MPVLMNMMKNETMIKIQTHAVSATINFARGLSSDEDDEEEVDGAKIMTLYAAPLFQNLIALLEKGISQNYEPLQEEVMNLISVVASLIENDFGPYFDQLMNLMTQILTMVGMTSMSQMTLRARTIEAMGFMIEAVQDDKDTFKGKVSEITKTLVQLLNSGLTNDDP